MRRRLNILSGLSLVLCMAILVLWVRSHWVRDAFRWGAGGAHYEFGSYEGCMYWAHSHGWGGGTTSFTWGPATFGWYNDDGYRWRGPALPGVFRFRYMIYPHPKVTATAMTQFQCEYGPLFLLTAILPAVWAAKWIALQRRLRQRPGFEVLPLSPDKEPQRR